MYRKPWFVAASAAMVPFSAASSALACGGFFCSAIQLVPVEQNAERILFEINPDNTVTSIVEIKFSGDSDDFSWVVPVPETPALDVVPGDALLLLDDATAPSITPPPTECTGSRGGLFGPTAMDSAAEAGGGDDDGGVVVEDLPQVGPYDPEVVSSDDADALINWLNNNDYLITAEMEPFVAEYVAAGMKFLAMHLAPDAGVQDIAPIHMTYSGQDPMIPIVLTAVAAEPEMGVLAFIAGESRYETANYENLEIDTADVRADPATAQTNYYPLVSWKIDEAGGEAFVTQFSGNSADVQGTITSRWANLDADFDGEPDGTYDESIAWLDAVAEEHGTITRAYLRMSGWEIASDPQFVASDGGALSNVHDLSDREPVEVCGPQDPEPEPCGEMYCGEGAECATTRSQGDGCVCPEGWSARRITAPRALNQPTMPTVTCQRQDFDLMGSVADMDNVGMGEDPCLSYDCGSAGQCVALNGFATCQCDTGYAAVLDQATGGLTCARAMKRFGPEQILWNSACNCQGSLLGDGGEGAGAAAGLLAPLLLGAASRRRRPARA
jgi:hypothetical protein